MGDYNDATRRVASFGHKLDSRGEPIKAGDWFCPKCDDHQFARNVVCRRCKTAKPLGAGKGGSGSRSSTHGKGSGTRSEERPTRSVSQSVDLRRSGARRLRSESPTSRGSGRSPESCSHSPNLSPRQRLRRLDAPVRRGASPNRDPRRQGDIKWKPALERGRESVPKGPQELSGRRTARARASDHEGTVLGQGEDDHVEEGVGGSPTSSGDGTSP